MDKFSPVFHFDDFLGITFDKVNNLLSEFRGWNVQVECDESVDDVLHSHVVGQRSLAGLHEILQVVLFSQMNQVGGDGVNIVGNDAIVDEVQHSANHFGRRVDNFDLALFILDEVVVCEHRLENGRHGSKNQSVTLEPHSSTDDGEVGEYIKILDTGVSIYMNLEKWLN